MNYIAVIFYETSNGARITIHNNGMVITQGQYEPLKQEIIILK